MISSFIVFALFQSLFIIQGKEDEVEMEEDAESAEEQEMESEEEDA